MSSSSAPTSVLGNTKITERSSYTLAHSTKVYIPCYHTRAENVNHGKTTAKHNSRADRNRAVPRENTATRGENRECQIFKTQRLQNRTCLSRRKQERTAEKKKKQSHTNTSFRLFTGLRAESHILI